MKRRNQLPVLIAITIFCACTNVNKKLVKEEEKPDSEITTKPQTVKEENLAPDSSQTRDVNIQKGITYSFANDTLCQVITVKEISRNNKFKIPAKLKFTLRLHDKHNKFPDKFFEGVASLTSSEESFFDHSDKDGGDYFAADYIFNPKGYEIQIRLDIEGYEACVVSVKSNQIDEVLGGYKAYLKEFPDDGIMKKGECK